MNDLISLDDAITRLRAGQQVRLEKIDLKSGKVSSVDALYLYRHGIEVEEEQIYYEDSQVAYDPEFDDHEWGEPYPAKSKISLELTIPAPVREWIDSKEINMEELISNLLISQMTADRIINDKK